MLAEIFDKSYIFFLYFLFINDFDIYRNIYCRRVNLAFILIILIDSLIIASEVHILLSLYRS